MYKVADVKKADAETNEHLKNKANGYNNTKKVNCYGTSHKNCRYQGCQGRCI